MEKRSTTASAAPAPPSTAPDGPSRMWLIVLLVGWMAAFYPLYPELISNWLNNSNNSHGILVPFISFYFIWLKRVELNTVASQTSYVGLAILFSSLAVYLIAYAGALAVVARAMIVFSLIGLVIFNWGWQVFTKLRFPLLFLFFLVPIPDAIYTYFAFPLQLFASQVSTALIRLTSIPVFREGNMLYFVQTQLEVAEACSGLRSITSYCMLAVLFAYLLPNNWFRRGILVSSAIPMAMAVNILRVTGTGILAHFWGGEVARGFLHDFSGMAVFALGFLLLAAEYRLLTPKSGAPDRA